MLYLELAGELELADHTLCVEQPYSLNPVVPFSLLPKTGVLLSMNEFLKLHKPMSPIAVPSSTKSTPTYSSGEPPC